VQQRVGLHHLCLRARSREDVDRCAEHYHDSWATRSAGESTNFRSLSRCRRPPTSTLTAPVAYILPGWARPDHDFPGWDAQAGGSIGLIVGDQRSRIIRRMPSATCWDREFADSPLEEAGFEPSVPHPSHGELSCRVIRIGALETAGPPAPIAGIAADSSRPTSVPIVEACRRPQPS
jgi:hypothetical protein